MANIRPNQGEPDIDEAIFQAVQQNDAHTLGQLLEERKLNPAPLAVDNLGRTVLHIAASSAEARECLELLLQLGDGLLDLNAKTVVGSTAASLAIENGYEENVVLLLLEGCEPLDSHLECAALLGYTKIVEYILRYSSIVDREERRIENAIHAAWDMGHRETFRVLLQKAAENQSISGFGHVSLHSICGYGHLDASCFFEYADLTLINHQNDLGVTPFMIAVKKFDLPSVRRLLENGARTDIYDNKAKGVLHYAAVYNSTEVFQFLLQSTDFSHYMSVCLTSFPFIGENEGRSFTSLMRCAINAPSIDSLDLLIKSELPKSILQMPTVDHADYLYDYRISSPLADLCVRFGDDETEEVDTYLQLLLNHKITMMDEFFEEFRVEWPAGVEFDFGNPFDDIIQGRRDNLRYYIELLMAHGVTTDYCVQCYNVTQSFDTFTNYLPYYGHVITAISEGEVELVQLFMSNSVILEPDKVLAYSIREISAESAKESICRYLTRLKPVDCIRELMRSSDSDDGRHLWNIASEEFSRSTLQQICRTAIRQQLREPSLGDNLRNFRRKILKLPLPDSFKDYLLFKI